MLIPPLSSSAGYEDQSIILLFLEVPAYWKTLVTFIPQFPLLQTKQHPSLYPPLKWQTRSCRWPLQQFLYCQNVCSPAVSPEPKGFTPMELLANLVLKLRDSKTGMDIGDS